jgi:uncharacterized protein YfaS (alpha-2-macroglobulin family)
MRLSTVIAAAVLAGPGAVASLAAQDTLGVLRHTPGEGAAPSSIVTIMFDRPIAGALEATTPAARLFHIAPNVAGSVTWRDPVTIRFIPTAPLTPGERFTVTLDASVRAVDGARLAAPYRFSFRVSGARLLARSFDHPGWSVDTLAPDGHMRLLYSAPVDLARLQRGARLELSDCPNATTVALRATRQRPLAPEDPDAFRWAGGYQRDTIADRFRTVVDLEPAASLPLECNGKVVLPTMDDDSSFGREERYAVRTAAVFRILNFDCQRWNPNCNSNQLTLWFASPVRRADIERHVHLDGQSVVINGQAEVEKQWSVKVALAPRSKYSIRVDAEVRDVYERRLEGPSEISASTDDHMPQLAFAAGIITMPHSGPRTIPLRSVNARSVRVIAYRIPDSARASVINMAAAVIDPAMAFRRLAAETTIVVLPDRLNVDTTTEIPLPALALAPDQPMVAIRVDIAQPLPDAYPPNISRERHAIVLGWPDRPSIWWFPYTLLQVTDLAVTARLVGAADGGALVTDLRTGRPRESVTVTQIDPWGRVVGRGVTDSTGVAVLARTAPDSVPPPGTPITLTTGRRYTVLQAESRDDRVAVPLGGRALGYRSGSPLDVNSLGGRQDDAPLVTGAIFADRDILRPGEVVHAKGVVRRGMLGALHTPAVPDSARVTIRKRSDSWADDTTAVVRDTVIRLSAFGTLVDSTRLRPGLVLGNYVADLKVVVASQWRTIRSSGFRLAEYRAPDFLVDLSADTTTRYLGDTVTVQVRGQYLFGAPMRRAVVKWTAEANDGEPPSLGLSPDSGWIVGGSTWWTSGSAAVTADRLSGVDTLDADGRAQIRIPVATLGSVSGTLDINAAVVDLTGQVVTATASASISSTQVFVLARPVSKDPSWRVGEPASIDVRAVDQHGAPARDVVIRALVLRHRWQEPNSVTKAGARWVIDTLRADQLRPAGETASFSFTPATAGDYIVEFSVTDAAGATSHTTVQRPATSAAVNVVATKESLGYRLPLTAEQSKVSVGDEARVHFDSPFRRAEAWITVEREGILERRRQRVTRGDNVVSVRIAERHAPNVFVSVILLARDDSATRPDTATERLRAGYVELYVGHEGQQLSVALATDRASYSPRDTVAIQVRVRDTGGRGVRSEVALWAVDQGVLALTGFTTPDIVSQLYAARGVGAHLWSTMPTLLTTHPTLVTAFLDLNQADMMLRLSAVVSMSVAAAQGPVANTTSPLRSIFNSTAFYLGAVETDARGDAVARAAVPDNLTTFRVMAVAVSAGDQYGRGDTTLLVTRPLVARAALPRFVRPSDSLVAGVVVTARDGRPRVATADASTTGLSLRGPVRMSVSLSSGANAEARFIITAPGRDVIGDSVAVRLGATDGVASDATETWLPVRPDFHPRTHAILGAVRDSQDVSLVLPGDIDPRRSRLRLRIGTSRLSTMLAAYRWLRAYRFDCTEQLASVGRGIVAVWQATKRERVDALGGDPKAKLQELVDEISRRQQPDGGIAYWPNVPWTSPWLTAYAGLFLLDARDVGVVVDPGVITRASEFLKRASRQAIDTGGMNRYEQRARRLALGDRLAAVDYLRRAGAADTATERALLRAAPAMTWEDRLRLAEVIAPRLDTRADAEAIVDAAWRAVIVAGHRVDLPDSANAARAFPSRVAPGARLLSASLALRPNHPLLAALIETVLQHGRAESAFAWSTPDYASVVIALAGFSATDAGDRIVSVRAAGSRFVARPPRSGIDTTISASLVGMLEDAPHGGRVLRLHVDASTGDRPIYYALEVEEVPLAAPVKPDIHGIVLERWYERFEDGAPVTRVNEGDLVRVRLRVTVPADREFVAVEDPLPAGLEPIDVGLRTSATLEAFATRQSEAARAAGDRDRDGPIWQAWLYGGWDDGHWSPWEHKELHDDRVSYFARLLWTGSYTATYVARATTAGSFVAPPAYAEEMYNPALQGRSSGGRFGVDRRP